MLMDNMVDVANTWILGGVLVSGQTTQLLLTKVFAMMDNFSIGKSGRPGAQADGRRPPLPFYGLKLPPSDLGEAEVQV